MWYSYFQQIENKYSMRISLKKKLVIRIDAINITKRRNISLLENKSNSFSTCFEKSIEIFTNRYNCLCFFGSDEASFIFDEPALLLDSLKIDKEKNARTNEIIAIFTQEFFDCFNELYNSDEKVFWHGGCFSIGDEKVNSYIKCRSLVVKDVMTAYLLKRLMIKNSGRIKMEEREKIKAEFIKENEGSIYKDLEEAEKGKLYLNGTRIDKEEFLRRKY